MKYIFTFILFCFCGQLLAQQKAFSLNWNFKIDVTHRAGHPFEVIGFEGGNFHFNAAKQKISFKYRG
jgi:hypothetical protein